MMIGAMSSVVPSPVQIVREQERRQQRDQHAEDDAGLRRAGAVDGDVAQGGERRHPRGADGRGRARTPA